MRLPPADRPLLDGRSYVPRRTGRGAAGGLVTGRRGGSMGRAGDGSGCAAAGCSELRARLRAVVAFFAARVVALAAPTPSSPSAASTPTSRGTVVAR